jgi:branched-chain amino acid transport system substrate-binding protein
MAPRGARSRTALATVAVAALALTACSGVKTDTPSEGSAAGAPIVIGASLPLSGPLAGFGSFQKWGYEHAVKEANDLGGITVGGTKRKVTLKIVDDKTDPNIVSANTESLISSDKVDGLLGSCTPALVIPGALVAERRKVPFVTGCAPLVAFTSAKKWTYAWDLFFFEPEIAELPFKTLKEYGSATNKKIAILHDNGPDGAVVGGKAWPDMAKKYDYTVAVNVEFPVENSDFTAAVQQAKSSGADILLVDAVTPSAVAIRKQMATAGYKPKVVLMEKGAEPVQYAQALGGLADGVLVGAYWDPTFPYPGAKELAVAFEAQTGQGQSQHIADSYTAARVLLDAIERAGSTDKAKINQAIAKTDKDYPVGRVKFGADNTAKLGVVEVQWQKGNTVVVWPKPLATGPFLFPVP